jgi:hypothetical protein
MATNTSEQDITKQMQDLIKDLDMMADGIAEATTEILKESGEIIAQSQRQAISGKSSKLASLIKTREIKVTKKGNANVLVGYDSDAVEQAPEGVVIEFGRPGKKRGGTDKLGRKIGKMEAIPHIRKGFDMAKEKATENAIEKIKKIIDKGWNK